MPLSSVCGGGGWLEAPPHPTPNSPSPAQLTNIQKHKPQGFCLAGYCPEVRGRRRPEPSAAKGRGAEGQVTRSRRERERGCSLWPRPPGRGAASGSTAVPGTFPVIHSIGCRPRSLPGPGLKMSGDRAAEAVEMGWLSHGDPWAPHMGDPLGVALTTHLQSDWGPSPSPGRRASAFPGSGIFSQPPLPALSPALPAGEALLLRA